MSYHDEISKRESTQRRRRLQTQQTQQTQMRTQQTQQTQQTQIETLSTDVEPTNGVSNPIVEVNLYAEEQEGWVHLALFCISECKSGFGVHVHLYPGK